MHPHLSHQLAQANQQELLRRGEQRRLARELPSRPSPAARLMSSIPSVSFGRRRSAELQRTAPRPVDA
jgi:hypothetical protein